MWCFRDLFRPYHSFRASGFSVRPPVFLLFSNALPLCFGPFLYSFCDNVFRTIRCYERAKIMKLILLDRDGVINEDREDSVKSPDEFVLLPGVLPAIKLLNKASIPIAI